MRPDNTRLICRSEYHVVAEDGLHCLLQVLCDSGSGFQSLLASGLVINDDIETADDLPESITQDFNWIVNAGEESVRGPKLYLPTCLF